MNVAKALWASIESNPAVQRSIHGWLTIAWLLFAIPVLLVPGWKESVALLVFISIYANVAGHWSAHQAAKVEVKQEQQGGSNDR